ncbi:MAG: MarR family transcriptional regulator [Bacteroidales bacterium]|jgi:DNA-binding MarR family transcriptional regulator|nr:MarR family transcriptional regulator [Bacteroidales bacterium]MDD3101374.1 MarR family transcriptional regulator [Bacteroidales bacterium]MDD3945583.1 MarR family transcriptional regulator [Bacteroidales bacterium]MDD4500149.1 MarR family transcriptional regulator [Bacteroidales bacterium]
MEFEQLKLSNQLCFPIYAASRLITREYQPHLDKLGITYPQYLVLMVLWENDGLTVNEIAGKLILNTNTVTPLLKRMETMKIITRTRSGDDERKVLVRLTQKGKDMRVQAASIPLELVKELENSPVSTEKLLELKGTLYELIGFLQK